MWEVGGARSVDTLASLHLSKLWWDVECGMCMSCINQFIAFKLL